MGDFKVPSRSINIFHDFVLDLRLETYVPKEKTNENVRYTHLVTNHLLSWGFLYEELTIQGVTQCRFYPN